MDNNKKQKILMLSKKLITATLAVILAVGTIMPISFMTAPEVAAAEGGGSTAGAKESYTTGRTGGVTVIKITKGSHKGYRGYCCDPWHDAPEKSGKTTVTRIPNDTSLARVAYYIEKKGLNADTDNNRKIHYTLSYARVKCGYKTSYTTADWEDAVRRRNRTQYISEAKSLYKKALEAVGKNDVPDRFDMIFLNPDGGGQVLVAWRLYDPGKASLVKLNANSKVNTLSGYTDFSGIKYGLYASDKKTKIGTFTVNSNGSSNVITGLDPGMYYAKEETANSYHVKSSDWVGPLEVKSNQTGKFYAYDDPVTSYATIVKKEEQGQDIPSEDYFVFHLVNKQNSSIQYDLTVHGNNAPEASNSIKVYAGTYIITEKEVHAESGYVYIDKTGRKELTVAPNKTASIEWSNESPREPKLFVGKQVTDGSSKAGFTFKVTGILDNAGTITKKEIKETVNPVVTIEDPDSYTIDTNAWVVNDNDYNALLAAAQNRNGESEHEVKLTNKLTHKPVTGKTPTEIISAIDPAPIEEGSGTIQSGTIVKNGESFYKAKSDVTYAYAFEKNEQEEYVIEDEHLVFDADATKDNIIALLTDTSKFDTISMDDVNITVTAKVFLKDVEWNDDEDAFVSKIGSKTAKSSSSAQYSVNYNWFDWYGAATMYKDLNTGRAYTLLTTQSDGQGYTSGSPNDPGIQKGISAGTYTITEMMTDAQSKRYRQPESITKIFTQEEVTRGEAISFTMTNEARNVPLKLKKTSPDNAIAGIVFEITGTTSYGEEISSMTGMTDEAGEIDFGEIPAGNYIIEETSFDKTNYINNHYMPGHSNPAVELDIDVDDDGGWTAQIKDDTTTTITGNAGEPAVVTFENQPITRLFITKVDGDSLLLDFLEDAVFELYEKNDELTERVARFQIVKNDDGSAGINMMWVHPDRDIKGFSNKEYIDPAEDEPTDDEDYDDENDDGDDSGSSDSDDQDDGHDDQGQDIDDQTQNDDQEVDISTLNYATLEGLTLGQEYLLREVQAPAGYARAEDTTFIFDENPTYKIIKNYMPMIQTVATDAETNTHTSNADSEVTINDEVTYNHLTPGQRYVMEGVLYHRMKYLDDLDSTEYIGEEDEPLLIDGNEVIGTKEFTADETGSGSVTVTFPTFDGTNLAGKGLTVYEYCYEIDEDGNIADTPVCEHAQPDEKSQMIFFPEIGTTANDPASRTGLGTVKENQTITDTVSYKNLDAGVEYKMVGTLYDKTTGELIRDNDGNIYSVSHTFTPEATDLSNGLASGVETITFEVDSTDLISHEIVAFEECYLIGEPDVLVGSHKDSTDEAQTIVYPDPSYDMYKIRTSSAYKKKGSDKYGFRIGDNVEYEVYIVNKGNCPLTLDVRDSFESNAAEYFSLPVIENIDNATQNYISEDRNRANITVESGETAVVTYSANVLPDAKEYLAAAAKDSDSKDIDGVDCNKVDQANTPDNKDGWINTAYVESPMFPDPENPEELIPAPEGDKNDPAQTPVVRPVIKTSIGKPNKNKVVDVVYYENLKPDEDYVMKGVLMNKKKVEEIDGSEGELEFTPSKSSGKVKVELNLKDAKYDVVAFEYCYIIQSNDEGAPEEFLIAEHTDIKDKEQTLNYNPKKNTPKTGEAPTILLYGGALLVLGGLTLMVISTRRKKTNK